MVRFVLSALLLGTVVTSTVPAEASGHPKAKKVAASETAGATALVLPVIPCSFLAAMPEQETEWKWRPSDLVAYVPRSDAKRVTLYSAGFGTVLGPAGWSCSASEGATGGQFLTVIPPGQTPTTPAATYQGIQVNFNYTGHGAGYDLVCPYFPVKTPPAFPYCTTAPPAGETTVKVTPDIVTFAAPSGFQGHTAPTVGVAIDPQSAYKSDITVALESCTVKTATVCPLAIDDFEVRNFPEPRTTPSS